MSTLVKDILDKDVEEYQVYLGQGHT